MEYVKTIMRRSTYEDLVFGMALVVASLGQILLGKIPLPDRRPIEDRVVIKSGYNPGDAHESTEEIPGYQTAEQASNKTRKSSSPRMETRAHGQIFWLRPIIIPLSRGLHCWRRSSCRSRMMLYN